MFSVSPLLAKLTRQERMWTGLLLGFAVPVALVFLLLEPMYQDRSRASQEVSRAHELLRWVETQARAFPAPAEATRPVQAAVGLAGLEQSLVTATLRDAVSGLAARTGGGVDLRFDEVEFTTLMAWVGEARARLGYDLRTLSVEAQDSPGMVAASLVLEPVS